PDGAKPGRREIGRVAHEEEHSLAGPHAERRERSGGASNPQREFREGQALLAADERGALAVAGKRFLPGPELGAVHPPPVSMSRTLASLRTSLRQARMMPLARSSARSACCELSSSTTAPLTSSHLQVPQLPVWQENGNGTPARSRHARIVSPA